MCDLLMCLQGIEVQECYVDNEGIPRKKNEEGNNYNKGITHTHTYTHTHTHTYTNKQTHTNTHTHTHTHTQTHECLS